MVVNEQINCRGLIECRESISVLRKRLGAVLSYCKTGGYIFPKPLANFLATLKEKLDAMFDLLPPCKLHIHDYRDLADGINRFRANKTLDCSTGLIVNCCMFICIFVEDDFSKSEFAQLLDDFDPEKDGLFVNENKK